MTRPRDRWMPVIVLVAATGLLIASIAWAAGTHTNGRSGGHTMTGPGAMMAGAVAGGGAPVRDLHAAERSAERFADRWGLTVGELMQFDNGFYAELAEPTGELATEVLIDARTGAVQIEWGPAMMWNTAYGMHPARSSDREVISPEQAREIANQWLLDNRPGEHADDADAFPGYYTLHTLRGEQVVGMLSVNAATGALWFHSWHGRFIAMAEHEDDG